MTFSCETLPTDAKAAIREMKAALREQLGDVQQVFDTLSAKIETRVAEIDALKAQWLPVWPEVSYSDIAAGTVSDATRNEIKRRGCAVIKGHFPREQALAWDRAMLDYLDINHLMMFIKALATVFRLAGGFSSRNLSHLLVASTDAGAAERKYGCCAIFLNRLWTSESNGKQWFDPDISVIYPDRIRRRPPGTTSKGLGAHTDSGALERWLLPAYQRVLPMCLMVISMITIPGMLHTGPKSKSTR